MQQGGDFSSYYANNYAPSPPNPNSAPNSAGFAPSNPIQSSYASAPPYSQYSADFPAYSSSPAASSYVPPYSQSSERAPPSAPSYGNPSAQLSPQFSTLQHYNAPPYPPEPAQAPPQPTFPHLQQSSSLSYYSYEPNQQSGGYAPPVNPIGGANQVTGHSSSFSSSYPSYDAGYQSSGRIDQGSAYLNENSGGYGGYSCGRSGFEQDFLENRSDNGLRFDRLSLHDDPINEGAYAYDGGRSEPYGSRGTVPTKSPALFDDYGRNLSLPSSGRDHSGSSTKIVRAVPKAETQQDVKNGVQKYRVKLLSEGGGQGTQDVLCQIGLDGIRMLDPSTNRTLRIYPLETLTRWEVTDSSIFSFWSKSSVDLDPRRIRLQSSSYTTNTILDTVTAATVQLKEMGGKDSLSRGKGVADAAKQSEQGAEKKKGIIDWVNMIKPVNEEKDHWVPDDAVNKCTACGADFGAFNRRHHCRNCGDIFCDKCTQGRIALTNEENAQPVRVCDRCMAEVSQRLNNAKEAANKPIALHSHEDLARKLQEEMEKNRKSSSGSKSSDSSGRRMREVACPICTVHLQVQVPTSGSETIECGVCQHPFLVSAH